MESPRSHERGPVEAMSAGRARRTQRKNLRALTSAAPLKRNSAAVRVRVNDSSPRSHERGPVEAITAPASIGLRNTSPRSHERGPVEAHQPLFRLVAQADLRALTSAAPLKQRLAYGVEKVGRNLRALTSAAPLKHDIRRR